MPLQNRVTPFGDFEASPARGLLMGNRGILHDDRRQLGAARWRHKNWVACVLSFKDRRCEVMAPGRYTELFFCDEAVALAAGHRPCAECRRADYERFKSAWRSAFGIAPATRLKGSDIDAVLHPARVRRDRSQVRWTAALQSLPDGTLVELAEQRGQAWLVNGEALHRWAHGGYTERRPRPLHGAATVLTPEPTVRVLAAGYGPWEPRAGRDLLRLLRSKAGK